jgi:hypothetical protein
VKSAELPSVVATKFGVDRNAVGYVIVFSSKYVIVACICDETPFLIKSPEGSQLSTPDPLVDKILLEPPRSEGSVRLMSDDIEEDGITLILLTPLSMLISLPLNTLEEYESLIA